MSCILLYCIVLFYIVLFFLVLYCVVLYCMMRHDIAMWFYLASILIQKIKRLFDQTTLEVI